MSKSAWNPIETAPNNGTWILAFVKPRQTLLTIAR